MSLEKKKKYGQFMTTNFEYILDGLEIPASVSNIIEPFAGEGDLISIQPSRVVRRGISILERVVDSGGI